MIVPWVVAVSFFWFCSCTIEIYVTAVTNSELNDSRIPRLFYCNVLFDV